jgi:type IV secretory pathway VirB3-like protein
MTQQKPAIIEMLSKPPLRWGVSHPGILLNGTATFIIGLCMGSPFYWIVALPIHLLMRELVTRGRGG